jgi:hypothetical protein
MQLEGFAYRFVPINTPYQNIINAGRIDSEIMYDNLMNKFTWGRMNEPDVLIDYYNRRTFSVMQIRNKFLRLAEQLISEKDLPRAIKVLKRGFEIMPDNKVQYDYFNMQMIAFYYELGEKAEADKETKVFYESLTDQLDYFTSLGKEYYESVSQEFRMQSSLFLQLKQICDRYNPELSEEIKLKLASYELN